MAISKKVNGRILLVKNFTFLKCSDFVFPTKLHLHGDFFKFKIVENN